MTGGFPIGAFKVRDPAAYERAVCAGIPVWRPGMPPVRLVVPSTSLRRHWQRRLAQERGAVLGVVIQTHAELAREILKSDAFDPVVGTLWPDELIRRFAEDEPVFRGALGGLDDGYRALTGPVYELIDAGLEPGLREGMLEWITQWPGTPAVTVGGGVAPRAAALVRVAIRVHEALEGSRFFTPGQAARLAAEKLKIEGRSALAAEHIWVVGFSDATGAVTELIEALHDHLDASVAVDVPSNPARRDEIDPGIVFASSFHQRFEGRWVDTGEPTERTTTWTLRCGRDPVAEMTQVADAIASLIEAGEAPEDIGLVARSLGICAMPIRRAFQARGVPMSGLASRISGGSLFRRATAIAEVLRAGPDAGAGRWLQACGQELNSRMNLAFDAMGVRRVSDIVDRLGDAGVHLRLPSREGLVEAEHGPRARSALVHMDRLNEVCANAAGWIRSHEQWPEHATAAEHWDAARRCLVQNLKVDRHSEFCSALIPLERQVPEDAVFSRHDALRMVASAVERVGELPLGGQGGGVQVLDAVEARSRTFTHVFIVGLNRGLFPRVVREDAILPDAARRALQKLLPDVREKRLGVDEERFLFAQMCGSSPHVHLSFAQTDLEGTVLHPSSLVIALQLAKTIGEPVETVLAASGPWVRGTSLALANGSFEAALTAGAASASFQALLAARRGWDGVFEPFAGSVGGVQHTADLRNRPLYVTTVEATARCPWRTFLEREIGIEKRPNPWGPLPSVSSHLVGRVVHSVAERAAVAAIGTDARELADAVPLVWPSDSTLTDWIIEEAERCLAHDGIGWTGFAAAVVPPALTALRMLKEMDSDIDGVSGVEVDGTWQFSEDISIGYRADRVEVHEGTVQIADLKLGRPPTVLKTPEKRELAILAAVREGVLLQGAVYAHAVEQAVGRYLYLHPDTEIPVRSFVFSSSDDEMSQALAEIVEEVVAVRTAGAWFPRVSEAKRDKLPTTCGYCEVKEACSVGDSGFRRRMLQVVEEEGPSGVSRARYRLWFRGSRKGAE